MKRIGNILIVIIVFMSFATNAIATTGEKNALQSAKVYLDVYPFSYVGLVEQLVYDGYSESEAVYAASHCNVNWYDQADRAAANYLSIMAFSRSGLIEQLEYDGFTHEQAEYGANQNGFAANSSSSIKSNNNEEVQNDSLQVQLDEAIGDKIDFTIYGDILPKGVQYTVVVDNQSEYDLEGLFCDVTLLDENGNSTLKHLEYSDTLFSGNNATISFISKIRAGDHYIDWGYSNAINTAQHVKDETKDYHINECELMLATEEYDKHNSRTIPGNREILRSEIISVRFVSSLDSAPDTAWDMSATGDGNILGWVIKTHEGGLELIIAADGVVRANSDSSDLFADYTNLEEIHFDGNFSTSNVKSMESMFADCTNLKLLDLSDFDTANVESMDGMFVGCESLSSINLSSFDTCKVKNMVGMFGFCKNLSSLDLSSFNTSEVTDFSLMFYQCSSLGTLDVSGFDTSKAIKMNNVFALCSSLISLDVSGFDTSNVESMIGMFLGCSSLTALDVSGFDTSNVKSMMNMFMECSSLKTIDISKFDTSNLESMSSMFNECSSLEFVRFARVDVAAQKIAIESIFAECPKLIYVFMDKEYQQSWEDSTAFFHCNTQELTYTAPEVAEAFMSIMTDVHQ